jgi:hypothetical protein
VVWYFRFSRYEVPTWLITFFASMFPLEEFTIWRSTHPRFLEKMTSPASHYPSALTITLYESTGICIDFFFYLLTLLLL